MCAYKRYYRLPSIKRHRHNTQRDVQPQRIVPSIAIYNLQFYSFCILFAIRFTFRIGISLPFNLFIDFEWLKMVLPVPVRRSIRSASASVQAHTLSSMSSDDNQLSNRANNGQIRFKLNAHTNKDDNHILFEAIHCAPSTGRFSHSCIKFIKWL